MRLGYALISRFILPKQRSPNSFHPRQPLFSAQLYWAVAITISLILRQAFSASHNGKNKALSTHSSPWAKVSPLLISAAYLAKRVLALAETD